MTAPEPTNVDTTDDLGLWLRVWLDEDERIALAAPPGPWVMDFYEGVGDPEGVPRQFDRILDGNGDRLVDTEAGALPPTVDAAAHIARHDPARVLREVEAKRLLLALHKGCDARCYVVRVMALPYADRPGYQEEWRP